MSKMKPKGFKKPKKRMDIDAFIEDELKNLNPGGGKPMSLSKPSGKSKKKNPAMIKPTFATKKIKKREVRQEEPLILNDPEPEEKPVSKMKMTPFKPGQIKPKMNMQPMSLPISDPSEQKPKKAQGPSKLLELQSRAKNKPYEEPEPVKEDSYGDSFENYDDDEFEEDDDK